MNIYANQDILSHDQSLRREDMHTPLILDTSRFHHPNMHLDSLRPVQHVLKAEVNQ
jgi:hypothetical protein